MTATRPGMLRTRGIGVSDWPGHPHHDHLARAIAAGVEAGDTDREIWHRLLPDDLTLRIFAARYGRRGERRPRRPHPTLFPEEA